MQRSAVLLACIAVSSCTCGQKALLYSGPHAEVTPIAAADSSRTLEFGAVGVGARKILPITVLNDGNEDLTVTPSLDSSSDPGFTVMFAENATLTVSPQDTLTLPVQFAPLQVGDAKGTILLDTNSSTARFVILLHGTGALTTLQLCHEDGATETCDDALPAGQNLAVDLGEPGLGMTSTAHMLLRAKGGAAIDVASIGLLPSSDAAFSLSGVPTLPVTLQPGDTIPFTAAYLPVGGGLATGTLEVQSDSTSRPRDDADLTGKADAPRLCIAAADLDFGDVSVNLTATKTAQLQNCGLEPLVISSITPGGPEFARAAGGPQLPQTLAPGASLAVDFTFHPTTSGLVQHPLAIATNEVHPSAFVQQGNGVRCTLDLQPGTIAFGSVATGSSASQTLLLMSIGDSDCTVTALTGPTGTAGFSIPSPPQLPLVIPSGLVVSLEVDFAPASTGAASATLQVVSNDSSATTQTVHLTASGATPPPCSFSAQPASVAFGAVGVGQSASSNVVITNSGTDECYITGGGASGDASFTATLPGGVPPATIASGASVTVPVKYTPQSAATHSGFLTINYANQPVVLTGGQTLKVPLSGGALTPKLCLAPAVLDFGSVPVGATPTKTFAVQSCGQGALTIRGIPPGAGTSHEFALQSPPAMPLVLAPNAVANITVAYSPTSTTGSAGSVHVLSNDPALPDGVVTLRGNLSAACASPLVCNPASLNFASVEVGHVSARQVNCTNAGASAVTITGAAISPGADPDVSLLAGRFPITLQPGDVLRAQVQFAPTAPTAGSATFTLQTGGCGDGKIQVSALGIPPKIPLCPPLAAFTPKTKWAWNGSPGQTSSNNLVMTPLVVNLTDDNRDGMINEDDIPDVVFASCSSATCCANCLDPQNMQNADLSGVGMLHAVSGKDGSEEWTLSDPKLSVPAGGQIAIADLDGDGIPEIIAVQHAFRTGVDCPGISGGLPMCGKYTTGNLEVFDHTGRVLFFSEPWTQPTDIMENESSILVADLDQDGSPEIIFGDTVFDSTGHVKWHMSKTVADNGHGTFPIAADVDGDGKLEVIAGPTAYRADGSVLWSVSGIADGFALIADVDGDGKPEVVLRPSTSQLVILNGATGAKIRTINLPTGSPSGIDSNACPAGPSAADFLGLGGMQIAVPAGNWFYLVRADTGAVIWQQPIQDYDGQCGASGAAAFSFFGDGKTDVVYHDSQSIYVWRGDGTLVYQAPRASSTLFETPVIADVDNDGHAEILITNQGLGGTANGLTVLSDTANSWPATRRIWGQWNYHVTDFNENGTVPRVEQPFWKSSKLWRGNPAQCTPH